MKQLFSQYMCYRFTTALFAVFMGTGLYGLPQTGLAQSTQDFTTMAEYSDMASVLTQGDIERLFNGGKAIPAFDPKRSVESLSQCAQWTEPQAPDARVNEWYRAATTLYATRMKTAEQYQQMLILYEAAARRGHYRATLHLTSLYSEGGMVRGGRFMPEPDKARMWINEGLRRGWAGALEWLSTALHQGRSGYPRNEAQSLMYLQLAADLGVALAQYELGLHYDDALRQRDKGIALFRCAANQGTVSAASRKMAMIELIQENTVESLQLYQQAIMQGGEKGAQSAFTLFSAFSSGSTRQQDLKTFHDPIRSNAYKDLRTMLGGGYDSDDNLQDGNPFLRFPRLNEVLPLPPVEVTEWQGVYSAMSPEDADYYQNPPTPAFYIEQIRLAGYLIPHDYLSQPVMGAE